MSKGERDVETGDVHWRIMVNDKAMMVWSGGKEIEVERRLK